ncbi:hypothetical protein GCM10023322_38670 [Rugosimonospora acidiphila]|uniref:Integral membrane protein n=1 Tax=Rugosimonospora acidiphila TaxID=556531 RepID=A0ABP9RXD6_9ACTN
MRTVTVFAPDSTSWRVRVVWQPRWRPLARRFGGWRRTRKRSEPTPARAGSGGAASLNDLSGPAELAQDVARAGGGGGGGGGWFDNLADDLLIGILVIIGLILFGFLFWWLLLPLLLLVVDVVVVVCLAAVAIPARVLLRRPWTVEARCDRTGKRHRTDVVGWRAALRARDRIADQLRLGQFSPVPPGDRAAPREIPSETPTSPA